MDKFTRPREAHHQKATEPSTAELEVANPEPGQPSLTDILSVIQGIRGALEGKIYSMTTEVTLLRADFRKMSERVNESRTNIATLQSENQTLKQQVLELQRYAGSHEAKLDDLAGRSRRNNILITWVPEKAEGVATDLCGGPSSQGS